MRIERLHVEGFGHYSDREFGEFDKGLVLVRGDNEAGKSTLLAFTRTVLFGFPTRLGHKHYPALRGGRHGGSIDLRLDDGRGFRAERVEGKGRGHFQLFAEDGNVLNEERFKALLGNNSEQVFTSAFTFDLDDLPTIEEDGADLGGLLYGVSMGAERLPQVVKRIDEQASQIFAPRGRTHRVAQALSKLEVVESHLREVADQADQYRSLQQRQADLAAELGRIGETVRQLGRQVQERERQQAAWKDWTQLRVLDERLASMEDTAGFPEDGLSRLERAEEQARTAQLELDDAQRDLEEAEAAADKPVDHAVLLQHAEGIERLRRGRDAVEASLRDLPKRQAELDGIERELEKLLGELGSDWDEERLGAFDLSIRRRDAIEQWRKRIEDRRQAERDAEREVTRAREAGEEAARAQGEAAENAEALADAPTRADIEARRDLLRQTRRTRQKYDVANQRAHDLEAQQRGLPAGDTGEAAAPDRRMAALPGVIGALLLVGSMVAAGAEEMAVALVLGVAGAVGVTVGIVTWMNGQRAAVASPGVEEGRRLDGLIAEAREAAGNAEQELRTLVARLGGDAQATLPDDAAIDGMEAALERDRDRVDEREQADNGLREANRALERAGAKLEDAERVLQEAHTATSEAEQGWEAWLVSERIPAGLAPDTAMQLIGRVEVAKAKAHEVAQTRNRVRAIEEDIAAYCERVRAPAREAGIDLSHADQQATVEVADRLIRDFDAAREQHREREEARARVAERMRAQEGAEQRLTTARRELQGLLEAGGAETAEDFRRRAAVHQDRHDLEAQRHECDLRLRQICGPDPDALAELEEALEATSLEAIEEDLERLREEVDAATERREALLTEQGHVESELSRLHDDTTASQARAERAALVSELDAAAAEWGSLTVARQLLRRVRERYEQERQPAVIQHASEFFRTITGGRYERLFQPLGESTLTVVDHDGSQKTPEELSRGTREQLYLALRFGAVTEATRHTERLPVIVDEVLVNFDPDRALRAAEGFAQLAQETQVIVFTCHPWVAEVFQEAQPNLQTISLD